MPRGASPEREREYEKLKDEFKQEHRYPGREEEVASRIVNKQRAVYGETKAEVAEERSGHAPDRNLPISGYEHLTIPEVTEKLDQLSADERRKIRDYESKHKNRKGVMEAIDRAS